MRKLQHLTFFLLLCTSVSAQTSFGVKGGVNCSYVRYDFDYSDYRITVRDPNDPVVLGRGSREKGSVTPALRSSVGVYVQWNFKKKAGLRTELLYQGQGSGEIKFKEAGSVSKNLFDCIMLPVSFSWKAKPRFTILAGSYLSYLAHVGDSYNTRSGVNSIDYGCQAGGEFKLTNTVSAGFTYYYGLADMLSGNSVERLRTAQLYVGYSLR